MLTQRHIVSATAPRSIRISASVRAASFVGEASSQKAAYNAWNHTAEGWEKVATSVFLACALSFTSLSPAVAAEASPAVPGAASTSAKKLPETVYFGNGCFWGRQKDFVDTEMAVLGRKPSEITSVVGYAGGKMTGPDGKVCYYYSDPRTVYERLGHAEVVKVDINADSPQAVKNEFKTFAKTYFAQFRQTRFGMQRLDPQDAGPGYRNVVGLPGGVNSPLFQVLKDANVNGMDLKEGAGNEFQGLFGKPTEDDLMNVVWVVDSNQLPFFKAEQYHQFHNGIGKRMLAKTCSPPLKCLLFAVYPAGVVWPLAASLTGVSQGVYRQPQESGCSEQSDWTYRMP
ncbi:hypothetical protein CEUSTIGMA_g8698.t1 [Chlamydomonas eustigma]|uniref:peptide-methionine (S)-S-oxide reductase n=1 Tax=Chlamydomonas eustigma TaxID=1157962 RepID=A0A250XDY2_9CHLO|nr:hypothetical protein CEUSTIGMA_g8698.t1 [Chlamydomonas eustigma]|eukprot:GAX81266.1 hypothetical protein CEUSTIGMA_g8698.t1 [Chlamydomonas eustigma]